MAKQEQVAHFFFYCDTFIEIDAKMKEEAELPNLDRGDIWVMSIDPRHYNGIKVDFSIYNYDNMLKNHKEGL